MQRTTHKHDWIYIRTQQRHHRKTGARLTPVVVQRCTVCRKERHVNAETGKTVRR